jgi:hypothetical protein
MSTPENGRRVYKRDTRSGGQWWGLYHEGRPSGRRQTGPSAAGRRRRYKPPAGARPARRLRAWPTHYVNRRGALTPALPHRECYRGSPAMTGVALAYRIAGVHGGEHQHGRAARWCRRWWSAIDRRGGVRRVEFSRADGCDRLASQASGAGAASEAAAAGGRDRTAQATIQRRDPVSTSTTTAPS